MQKIQCAVICKSARHPLPPVMGWRFGVGGYDENRRGNALMRFWWWCCVIQWEVAMSQIAKNNNLSPRAKSRSFAGDAAFDAPISPLPFVIKTRAGDKNSPKHLTRHIVVCYNGGLSGKSRLREGYPSGQRDQTVNLAAEPSQVRILPPPPGGGFGDLRARCGFSAV